MSEEEKKAIESVKKILEYWQTIVDIEDPVERDIEMSMYFEDMPFFEMKILLNLIEKQQKAIDKLNTARKNGTLSDGYHTYNDLYYQRCILFATICNMNKNISWKSARHSDGKKCFDSDNWFIVGIDTPKGSYTYHYEMKFWNLFKVLELEKGKEWDGHTEKDVIRLLSLEEE